MLQSFLFIASLQHSNIYHTMEQFRFPYDIYDVVFNLIYREVFGYFLTLAQKSEDVTNVLRKVLLNFNSEFLLPILFILSNGVFYYKII